MEKSTLSPYETLKQLIESKQFHHATYREIGKIWEGLWFYRIDPNGFRGYSLVGCINYKDKDLDTAHKLVQNTGISVGSYGNG